MPCWAAKDLHRLRRIEGLVEADADDVELVGAEQPSSAPSTAFVQRPRGGRADLEAAGVDEAHQQRLAAVARPGAPAGPRGRAACSRRRACRSRAWLARSALVLVERGAGGALRRCGGCGGSQRRTAERDVAANSSAAGADGAQAIVRSTGQRSTRVEHRRQRAPALSCTSEAKNAPSPSCGWVRAPAPGLADEVARRRPARPAR